MVERVQRIFLRRRLILYARKRAVE